ncbi:hypothetical protein FEM03_17550 [Phragmitibacter flavus]|uniref:Right handed beta helix domain-containing protein n=1 Tax=Phragmitibacter flavus TaxID=2576071 RepID=A0A5R8KAV8_9BACT|nr:right-handed parallel beta-helix repeat-containing protein [Phragmitibacter flavus]TLD69448.1 hypothetical protein FEM03_17550 [Phragmitibacter flavus]
MKPSAQPPRFSHPTQSQLHKKPTPSMRLHLFLVLLITLSTCLRADEIRLRPSTSSKTKILQPAIDAANPRDTLILAPGIYFETITINKPLTLLGQPGAILDGSKPITTPWTPAPDLPHVYTTPCKHRPAGLLFQDKFIAALDFDRAQKPGDWHWQTLLKNGPPLSQFTQIRALYIYHPREKLIYLRLPDNVTPSDTNLAIVPNDAPLITIENTQNVQIKDLSLRHSATSIHLQNSTDSTIEKCQITSYEETGILLTNNTSRCTIHNNQITRGALEEWQPPLTDDKPNYEIWRIHKDTGYYDRVAINLFRAGTANRILLNNIDRVFDGINVGDYSVETLGKPLTNPDHGRDTEIAHNLIENTRDSAIELGGGCINVNVHHNTLRRTHGGLRFKTPRIGPVFIHHNQLIDGSPFNIWFSMDSSPAEGFLYHNTITGKNPAVSILIHKPTEKFTTPNWHFINNLILTKEGIYKSRSKGLPDDLQISDHNLIQPPAPIDQPLEAAIDTGTDLSILFKGKLPDTQPTTFKGKSPDMGASEWR